MTKIDTNITFDDLKVAAAYIKDKKGQTKLTKAYMFAYEKHFGQKRLTGGDYIDHPLQVAYILTNINADIDTLCAALLHDVLEDCDVSREEMADKFGDAITTLVEGVTKIGKLNFSLESEAEIANQRKILVGLTEDVRVIIIKLADRLHNLRTIWVMPEKTQKKKAKETLDILTPIAHRLGMNAIKSELEDLSLRYSKPDVYFQIVEKLNQTKKERDSLVGDMTSQVSKILNENYIKHQVKGRSKSIYSIYKKLNKGKRFEDIFDLLALRIYVDEEESCYQALGYIHAKYRPIPKRFKDYIAMPKTNMYQSLHTTVFGIDGQLFEIQIRTYQMDVIAENGIASHWSYKEKGSTVKAQMQNQMEQKLQFFKSIMELKQNEESAEEFVKSVKDDILKHTIYVFTPKGDVIELPNGATPIDFAYRIHSSIGDKMVGAIVNNAIVPLDYQLKNNDIIKINTSQNSVGPSREWMAMAKTMQAKNKIRAFYNKIDKEDYIKNGEELLAKELRKRKISESEFYRTDNLTKILEEFGFAEIHELYINVGNNKLTPNQIINVLIKETETKEELILKKTHNKKVSSPVIKRDIIVEGIDDIKVNLATCCRPIPGDRIVGYITKGYGITVHRMVCPNVKDLTERIIDVEWNDKTEKQYPTTILVHASEEHNILLDIISKTSHNNIMVQSFRSVHSTDHYMYEITVLVENKEKLVRFLYDIEQIDTILDVERMIK